MEKPSKNISINMDSTFEDTDINKRMIQKIKRKIKRKIQRINDGFEIVFWEGDGCDEYGTTYWVECKNQFSGREWDVNPALKKSILKYKKNIIENGILYNDKKYYLRDDLYSLDLNKQFNIHIISFEEHQIYVENNKILSKLQEKILDDLEKKNKKASYNIRNYWKYEEMSDCFKTNLTTNLKLFETSSNSLLRYYSNFDIDIKPYLNNITLL